MLLQHGMASITVIKINQTRSHVTAEPKFLLRGCSSLQWSRGFCRCLADLRNSGDLSLRHASAQALARFVEAAKLAHGASEQAGLAATASAAAGLQGLALVLHRVVMPQIKQGSADANLAVRQVFLVFL